jgi:hypothetical protein
MHLKPRYDVLLSSFAFKFNLRRYIVGLEWGMLLERRVRQGLTLVHF